MVEYSTPTGYPKELLATNFEVAYEKQRHMEEIYIIPFLRDMKIDDEQIGSYR